MEHTNAWAASEQFCLQGTAASCAPYGNGHINDTYLVECRDGEVRKPYILQALNGKVFKEPKKVIANIERVTTFLRERNDDPRQVMHLVPAKDGKMYYEDGDNRIWRVYDFVEDSLCLEKPESAEDFYQSAVAFGSFQKGLSDFPASELYEVLPDFHNTPKRYRDFLKAVEEDICGRAKDVQKEIEFVKSRREFCSTIYEAHASGKLPLRVTHNDTKINNVLLDKDTRTALCVIDLDTIMPGFSVNDFGDSIRFGANTAAEDEQDITKVSLDLELFSTYTKGFLDGCQGKLTDEEIALLPTGAKMMTLECGMRFLTDYLQGDVYFKTKYPTHNLVRCHTQFALVEDMEAKWDKMAAVVRTMR